MNAERIFGNAVPGDTTVIDRPPVLDTVREETPAKPPMYAVLLHNDGSTNPRFVTEVLNECFAVDARRAHQIMMAVHTTNAPSVVTVVSKDVADTMHQRALVLIAGAVPDRDFFTRMSQTGGCELQFTVELETKGD